ncbi:MAG: type II toxin-antitoxin system PemK/MazF family toxin [Alphaproteobacteria bacterium]|nr:type II toxin-antitoxin system PemK/MazF family toxin [Alphaproteobacteria bacterium]
MPFPTPRPGLVIGYAYLWLDEHRRGRLEGAKDRPCAIVLTTEDEAGEIVVTVAPITHSQPRDEKGAVEIPGPTKRRLGLDDERSWVVVTEVNQFVWAGPDLRPVSREQPARFDFGMLPPALFAQIRTVLIEHIRKRQTGLVPRT